MLKNKFIVIHVIPENLLTIFCLMSLVIFRAFSIIPWILQYIWTKFMLYLGQATAWKHSCSYSKSQEKRSGEKWNEEFSRNYTFFLVKQIRYPFSFTYLLNMILLCFFPCSTEERRSSPNHIYGWAREKGMKVIDKMIDVYLNSLEMFFFCWINWRIILPKKRIFFFLTSRMNLKHRTYFFV